MSLMLTDSQLKKKQTKTIESLVDLLIARNDEHSRNMKSVLDVVNVSIQELQKISEAVVAVSEKTDNKELKSLQASLTKSVEYLIKESKSKENLTRSDLGNLVSMIKEAINNDAIIASLEGINKKLESNNKKWDFKIHRDSSGRMVKITAKQI